MELREFAERVLFATTLEEKLQCPDVITDERPGEAILSPDAPGRPRQLRFKTHGSARSDFPGLHRLEQERERGKLLHFFANHELLATELMALVLLKFPDAPVAFRKGVFQTLKDEQAHTRLYLARMKSCGIAFGELPVSGYFWRCVAPMENPIDYVAGLCLTFEQANLDFARHFARGFGQVGDAETARLLERIYRDEIGHVAYGLKWFRRWKQPDESDWEAFCRTLKFPLSPQRAKGFSLNAEGRRAAGFDPQFIAELEVYSQSKGRTPSVFVFNPFAEGRIAEGKAFNPSKHQAQLARDLENLPQFLCRQDDIVLVERRPSVEFLSRIKQAGFPLPEFVEISDGARRWSQTQPQPVGKHLWPAAGAPRTVALREFTSRKLGRLRPWAWSPDSVELLAPLFANLTAEDRSPEQRFNPGIAQLYSKAWSAELLRRLLTGRRGDDDPHSRESAIGNRPSPIQNWLCPEHEIGVSVNSITAALEAIATIRARGHHKIVVKQAIGLAGSNAVRLLEPVVLESHHCWMTRTLARGQTLIIEPWLERELDFSVQLEMTPAGLKLCGYTGLLNDAKGQFVGNWAEPHYRTRIPAKVVARFHAPPDISRRLLQLYADIFVVLETELRRADYLGPLGIDALVYRDAAGASRLKPMVEINPRYTMGRLAVELMRQTCQGSTGWLRLINRTQLRAEGCADFASYAKRLSEQFPLRLEGEPTPRIREGALCLNDPAQAQVCLAVFQVRKT
ncbi:MAG: DUF455 family protein [Verrucomicrobiae bacterium]|nr:DUF455 family protein [Verrucomicrobiae bacterium]